jgi:hypothetical protein
MINEVIQNWCDDWNARHRPQHAASSVVSLRSDETDHCRELARRMGSNRQLVGALHGACAHPAGVG